MEATMLIWVSVWSLFYVLVLKLFFLRKTGLQIVYYLILFTTTVSLCGPGWPQTSSYLCLPSAGIMAMGHHAKLGVQFLVLIKLCLEPAVFRLCPYPDSIAGEILHTSYVPPDSVGMNMLVACLSDSVKSPVMAEKVSFCTLFQWPLLQAFGCLLWVCMWISLLNKHVHEFLVFSEMRTTFMWKCSALLRAVFAHLMWSTKPNLTW